MSRFPHVDTPGLTPPASCGVLLGGLLLCLAVGACAKSARPGPRAAARRGTPVLHPVRIHGPAGTTLRRVLPGQLVRLGSGRFYHRYRGERELALRRTGRSLRVNGRRVGLDITGLEEEQAVALLGRRRAVEVVLWRDVEQVSPRIVAALARLTTRRLVLVIGQRLDAEGRVGLARLRPLRDKLHGLVLECELGGSELRVLGELPGLRVLWIAASLDPGAVEGLSGLRRLRQLMLPRALRAFGVGRATLRILSGLEGLRAVDLSENELGDASLKRLPRLRRLRWLNLSGNPVTAKGVRRLRKTQPGCHVVWAAPSAPTARPAVATVTSSPRPAVGLRPCDDYLRLIRCYAAAHGAARRRKMLRAVDRIAKRFKRHLDRAGPGRRSRAAVRKTCLRGVRMLRRLVSRRPAARHCLKRSR